MYWQTIWSCDGSTEWSALASASCSVAARLGLLEEVEDVTGRFLAVRERRGVEQAVIHQGRLTDRPFCLRRVERSEPEPVLHDLRNIVGERLQLTERVLADDNAELHFRHEHGGRLAGLTLRRSVPANHLTELRDEAVADVGFPVEGEQLLELVEHEHELLEAIAAPDLQGAEQIPQRRLRGDGEVEPRRSLDLDLGVANVGLRDLPVDRLDRTEGGVVQADVDGPVAAGAQTMHHTRVEQRTLAHARHRVEQEEVGTEDRMEHLLRFLVAALEQPPIEVDVSERRRSGIPITPLTRHRPGRRRPW